MITGWTDNSKNPLCPALAQPIEDSGAGVAYLVYGGQWGIRLKPEAIQEDWDLNSPRQWGETHLILAEERDLRYKE